MPNWAREAWDAYKQGYGNFGKFGEFQKHFKEGWGPDGNYKARDFDWLKTHTVNFGNKWHSYFNPEKKSPRGSSKLTRVTRSYKQFPKGTRFGSSGSGRRTFSRFTRGRRGRGYPRSVRPFRRRY